MKPLISDHSEARVLSPGARALRVVLFAVATVTVAALLLVSVGAAAGRYRVISAGAHGRDVKISSSSLLVVVPVTTTRLNVGDTLLARPAHASSDSLFHVLTTDSWTHQITARDSHGKVVQLRVGDQSWRVASIVPYAGVPFRWLVGVAQAIVLLLLAMFLVGKAAVKRRLYALQAAGEPHRSPMRRPWWWFRLSAGAMAALGLMSLTASATFTGTATVTEAAITTGHMQLTVPAAGATNRLTLGATGIAPGDTMSRALDLSVDSTTTTSIISSITLTMTAPTSSTLDTNSAGLALYIQKCTVAWTESGSSPAFSYTCGGTASDVLGTSGSPVSVLTAKSAQTLAGVSTTANTTTHLMVKISFPSADGDSYQDLTSALTFTFAGVQRSGQAA